MSHSFFVDVLTGEDGSVKGAMILGPLGVYYVVDCPNIIIATGGIGQVYIKSTNPSVATGDGIAAPRCGPRKDQGAWYHYSSSHRAVERNKEEELFLISEAVRGEAAF
jgi:L-aspartate oxidase